MHAYVVVFGGESMIIARAFGYIRVPWVVDALSIDPPLCERYQDLTSVRELSIGKES